MSSGMNMAATRESCLGQGRVLLCHFCWPTMLAIDERFARDHFQEARPAQIPYCGNPVCPELLRGPSALELNGAHACTGRRTKMCCWCYGYGTPPIMRDHCQLVREAVQCEAKFCAWRGTDQSALPETSAVTLDISPVRQPLHRGPICPYCWVHIINDDTMRSRYFFLDIRLGINISCATGPEHCRAGRYNNLRVGQVKIEYPIGRVPMITRRTGLCALCWHSTHNIIRGHVCYKDVELTLQGCESALCAERHAEWARQRDANAGA